MQVYLQLCERLRPRAPADAHDPHIRGRMPAGPLVGLIQWTSVTNFFV